MTTLRLVTLRPGRAAAALLTAAVVSVACSGPDAPDTPAPTAAATPSPSVAATPPPTPEPTPTPAPTPRFTNEPDPELRNLLPETVDGVPLVIPSVEEF
ncbi:MAG: hypothetical protein KY392_02475, partial [Chloroflexi bacterium]|nr:hypothetical protein [Chloroflexota bacterium]